MIQDIFPIAWTMHSVTGNRCRRIGFSLSVAERCCGNG